MDESTGANDVPVAHDSPYESEILLSDENRKRGEKKTRPVERRRAGARSEDIRFSNEWTTHVAENDSSLRKLEAECTRHCEKLRVLKMNSERRTARRHKIAALIDATEAKIAELMEARDELRESMSDERVKQCLNYAEMRYEIGKIREIEAEYGEKLSEMAMERLSPQKIRKEIKIMVKKDSLSSKINKRLSVSSAKMRPDGKPDPREGAMEESPSTIVEKTPRRQSGVVEKEKNAATTKGEDKEVSIPKKTVAELLFGTPAHTNPQYQTLTVPQGIASTPNASPYPYGTSNAYATTQRPGQPVGPGLVYPIRMPGDTATYESHRPNLAELQASSQQPQMTLPHPIVPGDLQQQRSPIYHTPMASPSYIRNGPQGPTSFSSGDVVTTTIPPYPTYPTQNTNTSNPGTPQMHEIVVSPYFRQSQQGTIHENQQQQTPIQIFPGQASPLGVTQGTGASETPRMGQEGSGIAPLSHSSPAGRHKKREETSTADTSKGNTAPSSIPIPSASKEEYVQKMQCEAGQNVSVRKIVDWKLLLENAYLGLPITDLAALPANVMIRPSRTMVARGLINDFLDSGIQGGWEYISTPNEQYTPVANAPPLASTFGEGEGNSASVQRAEGEDPSAHAQEVTQHHPPPHHPFVDPTPYVDGRIRGDTQLVLIFEDTSNIDNLSQTVIQTTSIYYRNVNRVFRYHEPLPLASIRNTTRLYAKYAAAFLIELFPDRDVAINMRLKFGIPVPTLKRSTETGSRFEDGTPRHVPPLNYFIYGAKPQERRSDVAHIDRFHESMTFINDMEEILEKRSPLLHSVHDFNNSSCRHTIPPYAFLSADAKNAAKNSSWKMGDPSIDVQKPFKFGPFVKDAKDLATSVNQECEIPTSGLLVSASSNGVPMNVKTSGTASEASTDWPVPGASRDERKYHAIFSRMYVKSQNKKCACCGKDFLSVGTELKSSEKNLLNKFHTGSAKKQSRKTRVPPAYTHCWCTRILYCLRCRIAQWFLFRAFDVQEVINMYGGNPTDIRVSQTLDLYDDCLVPCQGCGYYWNLHSLLPVVIVDK